MRTQRRKGLRRPPPSTLSSPLYQRILQFKALSSLRQWGMDVKTFALEFSDTAEGLGFNDAALKDLFNSALDDPLNWWRMRGLDHLTFEGFVEFLARPPAREAGVPQVAVGEAAVHPEAANGAAASRSQKRRRRRKKAASTLLGLEAVPEPSAGQEAIPAPSKLLALPAPPRLKLLALPSFEKDAVCDDEDTFCLSVENLSSLKVLLHQLESREAESEALYVSVRGRIEELWEMLQVPEEERERLMQNTHTSTKSRLSAVRTLNQI